ncbi:MAG: hypothetical protein J7L15_00950 [Clostridiales bacterium]|nr:hypothetical protein [Clostridiales bacterium]
MIFIDGETKMIFINVTDNTTVPDEGHKRQSSLGISEKRPHLISIVGGLTHSHDIFLDKFNAECLIEHLQTEIETMEKYLCKDHGFFEAHFSKCDKCVKL